MRHRVTTVGTISLALLASTLLYARENIVRNGSLELGPGPGGLDPRRALDWTFFGGSTVERSDEANHTPDGAWALKVFGGETTVGAYQDVPVAPGDNVTISALLYTRSNDRIGGDAQAKIKLEFLDAGGQPIGTGTEITVLDGSSPPNVWTPGSIGPLSAPSGAAAARMVCVWTWVNQSLGSAYWDDCTLTVNGGPNLLSNPDYELPGYNENTPFGIDEWIGFGGQWKSQDVAYHGASSVRVQTGGETGAAYSGLYQDMGVLEAGDHLFMRCWVYNPSVGGLTANSAAAIKLEFFPASGGELPPPEEALDFDENAPLDTWTLVSYTTTVPPEITLARIVMIAFDEIDTNGPVYVDLARAERGSAPGVNQLLNASFEQGTSGPNGLTHWTEFRGLGCSARKNAFEVPAYDGFSVLKISGSCVAGVYQEIEVQPGEQLTISAYFYSDSDNPFNDPQSRAGVKVEWRAGNVPPQVDIGGQPFNTIYAGAPTDTWLPLYIDYTMPPGSAATARYTVIVARGEAESAQVYFDAAEAVVLNLFDGADVDGDVDQDLLDFYHMQRCFSGTGVPALEWNSITFDADDDDEVDWADFQYLAPRFTGPN